MQITLYTDGACDLHADNRPGGWAAILCATDANGDVLKETVLRGGGEDTTNNRMELTAVIEGLRALQRPSEVTIVTDSRYVIDIASEEKRSRANIALWDAYAAAAAKHIIDWVYIEGHSGHPYNERCDKIAVAEKNRFAANGTCDPPLSSGIRTDFEIYLSTAYSGKSRSAAWFGMISGADETAAYSDVLTGASELEAVLVGALTCLRKLPAGKSVTVYTAQEYLAKGITHWLPAWLKRGWKTKNGEPVKYQQHWQALWHQGQQREIYVEFVKSRGDNPHFERGKAACLALLKRIA